MIRSQPSPAGSLDASIGSAELLDRYAAYRRRQAWRLLHLLPRHAVRPLYRRALAEGLVEPGSTDPLSALLRYCEQLLPLPPFATWRRDVETHPEAYLADLDESAEVPSAEAPATLAARAFERRGRSWVARLRSFRDGSAWRGFIAFDEPGTARVHRTALIFRESSPVDLRERFAGFEDPTLEALLRSTLP